MSRPPVECRPRWPVCNRKHEPLAIRIAGRWAERVAPADRHEGDRASGHPGSTVRRLHGDAESGQVTPRDSVADRNAYGPEGDARVRGLGRSVESTCGAIERRPGRLVGDRKSQPLPSASRATGRKLYCSNALTDVAGAPEILGAVLAATAVSGAVHETRNNAPTNAGTPRFMLTPPFVGKRTDRPCLIPGAVLCDRGVEAPLGWRDSRRP